MNTTPEDQTRRFLRELGFTPHHAGYKMLSIAIPQYAQDNRQSITKELYPAIAKQLGCIDRTAVEHSIRYTISATWKDRDSAAWDVYFRKDEKAPSNMVFIATLAELLK